MSAPLRGCHISLCIPAAQRGPEFHDAGLAMLFIGTRTYDMPKRSEKQLSMSGFSGAFQVRSCWKYVLSASFSITWMPYDRGGMPKHLSETFHSMRLYYLVVNETTFANQTEHERSYWHPAYCSGLHSAYHARRSSMVSYNPDMVGISCWPNFQCHLPLLSSPSSSSAPLSSTSPSRQ